MSPLLLVKIICYTFRPFSIQLELIYYFTYFSIVVPSNSCVFLSCRPFVVNTTFSTGLVGVEVSSVSWLGQLTVGIQITEEGRNLYISVFICAGQ